MWELITRDCRKKLINSIDCRKKLLLVQGYPQHEKKSTTKHKLQSNCYRSSHCKKTMTKAAIASNNAITKAYCISRAFIAGPKKQFCRNANYFCKRAFIAKKKCRKKARAITSNEAKKLLEHSRNIYSSN